MHIEKGQDVPADFVIIIILYEGNSILKKIPGKAKKTKPPQNALRAQPWPNSEPTNSTS